MAGAATRVLIYSNAFLILKDFEEKVCFVDFR
jgi:hypothetical protein